MVTRKPKRDPQDKKSELSEEDIREMESGRTMASGADAVSEAGGE